jgi:hypothetical protein
MQTRRECLLKLRSTNAKERNFIPKDILAVYTDDDISKLIEKGATGNWPCGKNALMVPYVMVVSKRPSERGQVKRLVKVTIVEDVPPITVGGRRRYKFLFDEYVKPEHTMVWGTTSPIRYLDSALLHIDVKQLKWRKRSDENKTNLSVKRYMQLIAQDLGLRDNQVKLTLELD